MSESEVAVKQARRSERRCSDSALTAGLTQGAAKKTPRFDTGNVQYSEQWAGRGAGRTR